MRKQILRLTSIKQNLILIIIIFDFQKVNSESILSLARFIQLVSYLFEHNITIQKFRRKSTSLGPIL